MQFRFKIDTSQNLTSTHLNRGNFQLDNNGFMTAYFGNVLFLFTKCQRDSLATIENFVDIGSGDGAVTYFMARKFHRLRCLGIEIDERLHKLASSYKSREISNLQYLHSSALDWNFQQLLNSISVLFFFNSFGEKSLEIFLNQLDDFCLKNNLTVYFIYLNDVHRRLLEEKGFKAVYMNQRKQSVWQIGRGDKL